MQYTDIIVFESESGAEREMIEGGKKEEVEGVPRRKAIFYLSASMDNEVRY